MTAVLALYKGPPRNDWAHWLSHYATCLWTASTYSHAELMLDGVCWSSSARDGGVRPKLIDTSTGRWVLVPLALTEAQQRQAAKWFEVHTGEGYDWAGIFRFVLPFLPHSSSRWFCFEAIGAALGFPAAHKLTGRDLARWAQSLKG